VTRPKPVAEGFDPTGGKIRGGDREIDSGNGDNRKEGSFHGGDPGGAFGARGSSIARRFFHTDGKIRFEYVNPDYKSRLDPDVLLAMAKAALKK
jgi:hypothetical protein